MMKGNKAFVTNLDEAEVEEYPWGTIRWLCNKKMVPEAKQTFGYVVIDPGKENGVHSHPNCEEILFVIEGECLHSYDDKKYNLKAGEAIFIPADVKHNARNIGDTPLKMIVSYSSPERKIAAQKE